MSENIIIRKAELSDREVLTEFNCQMAYETEGKKLLSTIVANGVDFILNNPKFGFYLVAECQQNLVASLMITPEWSDWRNNFFWWIQSVYVHPDFRQKGIYRSLYKEVKIASKKENICGFRLYVDKQNEIAQNVYKKLGMEETNYFLFEEMTDI